MVIDVFQIFIPCLVGTILTVKGDDYYDEICKISWHTMSLRDQKSISLMISAATKSKDFSFGLMKLNLESFLEVISSQQTTTKFN